ncbi:MAG: type II toxin-antitoxin system PemK/MazF family toxin [Polaromonas sp.]
MSDLKLEPFDVVVVPFPFTDRNAVKRRPALVLSSSDFNQKAEHSVLAMITSAGQSSWPGDHFIKDLDEAGLPTECLVRLKLFTLDHRLVIRKAGALSAADQKKLRLAWKGLLAV